MSETSFGVVSLTLILILFIYAIGGSFFEHKHFHLIHETGLGILLGILAGGLFTLLYKDSLEFLKSFNEAFFFYILLPVIIFSGGYNLNKRRFFQNFLYISLFGLIGTILTFLIILGLTIAINSLDLISVDKGVSIKLTTSQMMIFSATICATDSVAALTMIKPEKYPKLFSVLFGEGMVNDAVSIILFVSVGLMQDSSSVAGTSFSLIGLFLLEFIGSLGIGLLFGLFTAYLFKNLRFLSESCVLEVGIVLYIGYASFTICDLIQLSGVISVLITGVVLAHYNFYNLSNIGQLSSRVSLQTISLMCESFIYVYLGISLWNIAGEGDFPRISWSFIFLELLVCFISRAASMFIITEVTQLIKGKSKFRLSFWELNIVWFAGLIRGSIAYALISKLEDDGTLESEQQVDVLKNSVLILVILTTIVLGGIMPFYVKFNLKYHQKQGNNQVSDEIQEQVQAKANLLEDNFGKGETEQEKRFRGKVQKFMKKLDSHYFKPWFIYDYENRKHEIRMIKKIQKKDEDTQQDNPRRTTLFKTVSRHQNDPNQRRISDSNDQFAKLAFRSSFQSKFTGNQDIYFTVDVPINQDDAIEEVSEVRTESLVSVSHTESFGKKELETFIDEQKEKQE